MSAQSEQLKKRISQLSDEELGTMVYLNFADYQKETLECARAEIAARGISFIIGQDEDKISQEIPAGMPGYCFRCATQNVEDMRFCRVCGTRLQFDGGKINTLLPHRYKQPSVERGALTTLLGLLIMASLLLPLFFGVELFIIFWIKFWPISLPVIAAGSYSIITGVREIKREIRARQQQNLAMSGLKVVEAERVTSKIPPSDTCGIVALPSVTEETTRRLIRLSDHTKG